MRYFLFVATVSCRRPLPPGSSHHSRTDRVSWLYQLAPSRLLRPAKGLPFLFVRPGPALSDDFKETAALERSRLLSRYEACLAEKEHHAERADAAAVEADRLARTIREIGELLGIEDQLSITELHDDLRGERLREVASKVLWQHFQEGDVVHYKQWFDLVVADGHRIGGKNPAATFLTQVARVSTVERTGRRSGLYKLKAVA
jgi:hypothetical protein